MPPMTAPYPVNAKKPKYSAANTPAPTLPKPKINPIIIII
jgi:hypothetical protein